MNRKHITHFIWLAVAAVTFGLGWFLKPTSDAPDHRLAEFLGNGPDAVALSALPAGQSDHLGGGAPLGSEFGRFELVSTEPLDAIAIQDLGEEYRSTLDPIAKRLAFSKLIAGMTVENALDVRAQIDHLPANHPAFRDFHYAWGKIGGNDAVMHGADTKKPDMHATLAGFAAADPASAMAWFESLPKERTDESFSSQDYLKVGLINGLADRDPDAAADYIIGLANSGDKGARKMIATVANKVMQSEGPDAAASWTTSLPEGQMRDAATGHVAHGLAQRDPESAASWAQGVGTTHAMAAVGHEWAKRDGAAAVGWLDSMGDGASGTAYFHTFEAWVGKDPQAASQHLVDMPPSPNRDMSIHGMINSHRWSDPISASTWAGEISNPEVRIGALTRVGEAFFRKDPAGAAAWLPTSGLPAETQARLSGGAKK